MSDIIGHDKQKEILFRFSRSKTLPHAFLFCGPEKVGKKSLAFDFIKFISCLSENSPCGKCPSCKQINNGTHADFTTIYPEKGEICLPQIERLINSVSLRSSFGKVKVALIDEAHTMNHQAQNSLLKTLEEPPGDALIILVTAYPSLLLPTIVSRTFKLKFSFVPEGEIASLLTEKGCRESDKIADLSFGRPGLAVNYFSNPEARKTEEKRRGDFMEMMKKGIPFRFSKIKETVSEEGANETMDCWIKCLREEFLNKISKRESVKNLGEVIREMEDVILFSKKTNTNLQLALEKVIIKL